MNAKATETQSPDGNAGGLGSIPVRRIPFDRPWEWLAAGWRDLWSAPRISLLYGATAAAIGFFLATILVLMRFESLVPVLAGGFLLVGPLLAVGLYETSRRLMRNEKPTFAIALEAILSSTPRLGFLTAFLIFLYLVWVRIAFMLLALFLGTGGLPPAPEFMTTLLFTSHGLGLLIVGTAFGALLAAVAFATTVISIPLLMDRQVDMFTAVSTSIDAVIQNWKPMALWAALIAGFIGLGLATMGIGLVFVFPLLGHATWHAYCDILGQRRA